MKVFLLALTFLTPFYGFSQDNSQKTLWPNGVNAAAFGEIGIDQGTVNERQISNLRLLAGFQFLRLWDMVSISFGYGKIGWYDAVYDWDDKAEKFQFNYQGPTAGIHLFPNGWVSIDAVHFFNPKGRGVEKILEDSSGTEVSGADFRYRFEYKIQDTTIYMGIKIWEQLRLVLGVGNRTIDWESRITADDEPGTVTGLSNSSGSESEQYFLLGIRGTQLMSI